MKEPLQEADVLAAYRVLPSGALLSVFVRMALHFVHQHFPKEYLAEYEETVRLIEARENRRPAPPSFRDNLRPEDEDDPLVLTLGVPSFPRTDTHEIIVIQAIVRFYREAQRYVSARRERIPADVLVLAYSLYAITTEIDGQSGNDSWTGFFATLVQARLSTDDREAMAIWTDKAAEAGDLVPASTFWNLDVFQRTPFPALHSLLYGSTQGSSVASRLPELVDLPYPVDRQPIDVLCKAATFQDRHEVAWRVLGLVKAISQVCLDTHEVCAYGYSKRVADLYPLAVKYHEVVMSIQDLDWEWHRPRIREVATLWRDACLKNTTRDMIWHFVSIRFTLIGALNELLNREEEHFNPDMPLGTDNPYINHRRMEEQLLLMSLDALNNPHKLAWVKLKPVLVGEPLVANKPDPDKAQLSEKLAQMHAFMAPDGASLIEWLGRYEAVVLRAISPWLMSPKPEGWVLRAPSGKPAGKVRTETASLDTPAVRKPRASLSRVPGRG